MIINRQHNVGKTDTDTLATAVYSITEIHHIRQALSILKSENACNVLTNMLVAYIHQYRELTTTMTARNKSLEKYISKKSKAIAQAKTPVTAVDNSQVQSPQWLVQILAGNCQLLFIPSDPKKVFTLSETEKSAIAKLSIATLDKKMNKLADLFLKLSLQDTRQILMSHWKTAQQNYLSYLREKNLNQNLIHKCVRLRHILTNITQAKITATAPTQLPSKLDLIKNSFYKRDKVDKTKNLCKKVLQESFLRHFTVYKSLLDQSKRKHTKQSLSRSSKR